MMKIAFMGNMQAGKSTCADYLETIYGLSTVSFADRLKLNLIDIGMDPDHAFGKKTDLSRSLMQIYGEYMRSIDKEHWVKYVLSSIAEGEEYCAEGFVIDDLRFVNEADALREEGFVIVKVVKYEDTLMCTTFNTQHVSENEWRDIEYDYSISAHEGDLPELFGQVDDIVHMILRED
jgi:adenylate kinase family enzyme